MEDTRVCGVDEGNRFPNLTFATPRLKTTDEDDEKKKPRKKL